MLNRNLFHPLTNIFLYQIEFQHQVVKVLAWITLLLPNDFFLTNLFICQCLYSSEPPSCLPLLEFLSLPLFREQIQTRQVTATITRIIATAAASHPSGVPATATAATPAPLAAKNARTIFAANINKITKHLAISHIHPICE